MPEQPDKNPSDLKALLHSKNVTLADLARHVGADLSTVSKLCKGTRPLDNWAEEITQYLQASSGEVWSAYNVRALPQYRREHTTPAQPESPDLYALAKAAGYSQQMIIAGCFKVHVSTINHMFRGDKNLPDKWETRLATLFKVAPSEVRQAYEQRALPQFKRQPPGSPAVPSPNGHKPPEGIEVA